MTLDETVDILGEVPTPTNLQLVDQSASNRLRELRSSLYRETQTLQSCIALFDHSSALTHSILQETMSPEGFANTKLQRDMRLTRTWPFIAAREALGALYNFHWALKEIDLCVQNFPAEITQIDRASVADLFADFEKKFNKAILARHASSHRSEISNNFGKNAHRGGLTGPYIKKTKGTAVMLSGNLLDRTYTETRKGELLKFDVTWETYAVVLEIYKKLDQCLGSPALAR
jgi:hypothetical protein